MVEAECLIGHLRDQVRGLQALLNYLESRSVVGGDDYAYSRTKLHSLIGQLKALERFSSTHGRVSQLQAVWLN